MHWLLGQKGPVSTEPLTSSKNGLDLVTNLNLLIVTMTMIIIIIISIISSFHHHVIISSSCHHAIMPSCHHAIMPSCHHHHQQHHHHQHHHHHHHDVHPGLVVWLAQQHVRACLCVCLRRPNLLVCFNDRDILEPSTTSPSSTSRKSAGALRKTPRWTVSESAKINTIKWSNGRRNPEPKQAPTLQRVSKHTLHFWALPRWRSQSWSESKLIGQGS